MFDTQHFRSLLHAYLQITGYYGEIFLTVFIFRLVATVGGTDTALNTKLDKTTSSLVIKQVWVQEFSADDCSQF
jgi:hypothetical protein